jgi:hypothetical protein
LLTLAPHGFFWFALVADDEDGGAREDALARERAFPPEGAHGHHGLQNDGRADG